MYMHIRKANSKRIPLILKKIEMIEFYRYKSFEQNSTVNRINLLFLLSFLLSIIRVMHSNEILEFLTPHRNTPHRNTPHRRRASSEKRGNESE